MLAMASDVSTDSPERRKLYIIFELVEPKVTRETIRNMIHNYARKTNNFAPGRVVDEVIDALAGLKIAK